MATDQMQQILATAVAATALILAHEEDEQNRKQERKRLWVRPWIARRSELGAYACLLQEISAQDPKACRNFLRMTVNNFNELLQLVGPLIQRQDTQMRKAISPEERLAVTLRYLGSGASFKSDLTFLFRLPDNTISVIVKDTCEAIISALQDKYLKMPSTHEEWRSISQQFEDRWNLPNCVGALDGKHVRIKSPGGSEYFNYLKYHSIILLALVDADYKFIYVDVGSNGKAGDAGVFRESTLAQALESDSLSIPPPTPLPDRVTPMPHYIVGDDAFPLKTYLLKPYPSRSVSNPNDPDTELVRRRQRIFDYRLSRARRIVENVFGILVARFGILRNKMNHSPERATTITMACILLHNFLRSKSDQAFMPPSFLDRESSTTHDVVEGEWRDLGVPELHGLGTTANRSSLIARDVRNELLEWVNDEGQVPWQERQAFLTM